MALLIVLLLAVFVWGVYKLIGPLPSEEEWRGSRSARRHEQSFPELPASQRGGWLRNARQQPAPIRPQMPVFHFEGNNCELCSARSLMQFKHSEKGLIFEFCGHHGNKQKQAMLAAGYKLAMDISHWDPRSNSR